MNKFLKPISSSILSKRRKSSYNVNETIDESGNKKPCKSADIYPVLKSYKTDEIEDDVFEPKSDIDLIEDNILEYILSFLTVVDLVRCSRVSKRFNRIVWDAEMWKKTLIFNQPVDVDQAIEKITTKLWLNAYAYPKWTKITNFSVTNGAKLTDKALNILTRHLPSLLFLKIHDCEHITDNGLQDFTRRCEKLFKIDISGCVNVHIFNLNTARPITVNFTGCSGLRDHGFFDTKNCNDLIILYLNGCSEITDYGIGCLSNNAKKLRKLVLADCIRLTDLSMEHLRNLRDTLGYLSISNALGITNNGASVFSSYWPQLQVLDLSGCLSIIHDGFLRIGIGCKKLRTLNCANSNVCDVVLKSFGKNLVNLKSINLKNCYFITEKGLKNFMGERRTSLKNINIKGCAIKSEFGYMYSGGYFIEYDDTLY